MCGVRPATTREHIWPRWYLKRMDAKSPPTMIWTRNGEPILDRRGDPVAPKERQRVLLDICERCNTELDRRFEKTAKAPIEELILDGWAGTHSAAEWSAVGMWFAKVTLMLGHSNARIGHDLLNEQARIEFDGPMPDYSWMVDGSAPPSDLSLFVFRADMESDEEKFRLVLPSSVLNDDGTVAQVHVFSVAMEGISVTVVSHPGTVVEHPMVKIGEAAELLHSPPDEFDLSSLPHRGHHYVRYLRGGAIPCGETIDESDLSFLRTYLGHSRSEDSSPPS